MSIIRSLRTKSYCFLLGPCLLAQGNTKKMDLWPYMNPAPVHVQAFGQLFQEAGQRRATLLDFEVGGTGRATKLHASDWVEFRFDDGSSQTIPLEYVPLNPSPFLTGKDGTYLGTWKADFMTKSEISGYRIFVHNEFFAEAYPRKDSESPKVQITETAPNTFQWEITGHVDGMHTTVMYSRDYGKNWWAASVNNLKGIHKFEDWALANAQHPMVIRMVAYQGFRRFVSYYQMGVGYLKQFGPVQ